MDSLDPMLTKLKELWQEVTIEGAVLTLILFVLAWRLWKPVGTLVQEIIAYFRANLKNIDTMKEILFTVVLLAFIGEIIKSWMYKEADHLLIGEFLGALLAMIGIGYASKVKEKEIEMRHGKE